MKKILIITCVCILSFIIYQNYFKRNAFSILRTSFGLSIDERNKIIKYEDDWGPNGDGQSFIRIKLNDSSYKSLVEQMGSGVKKYSNLPLSVDNKKYSDEFYIGLNAIKDYSHEVPKIGYYKIEFDEHDDRSFSLLIIDTVEKEIVFFNQIM